MCVWTYMCSMDSLAYFCTCSINSIESITKLLDDGQVAGSTLTNYVIILKSKIAISSDCKRENKTLYFYEIKKN